MVIGIPSLTSLAQSSGGPLLQTIQLCGWYNRTRLRSYNRIYGLCLRSASNFPGICSTKQLNIFQSTNCILCFRIIHQPPPDGNAEHRRLGCYCCGLRCRRHFIIDRSITRSAALSPVPNTEKAEPNFTKRSIYGGTPLGAQGPYSLPRKLFNNFARPFCVLSRKLTRNCTGQPVHSYLRTEPQIHPLQARVWAEPTPD